MASEQLTFEFRIAISKSVPLPMLDASWLLLQVTFHLLLEQNCTYLWVVVAWPTTTTTSHLLVAFVRQQKEQRQQSLFLEKSLPNWTNLGRLTSGQCYKSQSQSQPRPQLSIETRVIRLAYSSNTNSSSSSSPSFSQLCRRDSLPWILNHLQ